MTNANLISLNTFAKFAVALIVVTIATAAPASAAQIQAFSDAGNFVTDGKDFLANNIFPAIATIAMLIFVVVGFWNPKAGAIGFIISLIGLVLGAAIPGTVSALY